MPAYIFMRPSNQPIPTSYTSTPERFMSHASFLIGQRTTRPTAETTYESGYQTLRLATELVPATLAVIGTEQISPFWAVLFYFILILFGIAQQVSFPLFPVYKILQFEYLKKKSICFIYTVGNLALRYNWNNGYQHEDDEDVRDYHNIF